MKKTITTLLLITLTIVSVSAQNSIYKGGEVIKINDTLTLKCTDYQTLFIELTIQSPIDIRQLDFESRNSITGKSDFSVSMEILDDIASDKNTVIRGKVLDLFCNILTPEQFQLFAKNSTQASLISLHIYYCSSDGLAAAIDVNLVKNMPVFMELPPHVYGEFMEQIKREIKLVDVKYKLTPYMQGTYFIQLKDVIKRYPELHK